MSKLDATRSRITGRPFKKQDPSVRRHGPMKKREVYRLVIEKILNDAEDWMTAEQIAYEGRKYISSHWSPLSKVRVGAILRPYVADGKVRSRTVASNTPKQYKSRKKFDVPESYLERWHSKPQK